MDDVCIKLRAIEGKAELRKRVMQDTAQTRGIHPLHASANSNGKMVGARKYPDVSMQTFQELDLHRLMSSRNVITGGNHEVLGAQLPRKLIAERVPSACCQHHEIRAIAIRRCPKI